MAIKMHGSNNIQKLQTMD